MDNFLSFRRVLIINIFGIGDVLFTTPLVANIKKSIPNTYIGYLCNKRTAPVLANNPKINKIFIYEKDDFRAVYKKSKIAFLRKIVDFLGKIKKEKFDTVIDLSLSSLISYLMFDIKINQRVGFNYKNRGRFLTTKIDVQGYEDKHVIEYYLSLLELFGIPAQRKKPELFLSKEEKAWANEWLSQHEIAEEHQPIAFVPGGGASWGKDAIYKRWPAEKYARLADKVVEKFNAPVILMGDTKETEVCRRVQKLMKNKAFFACGETTIGQMAALLAQCRLAIVNDGGPLHIAVAAGTKTVSIFGPVDPVVYGPYPPDNHIIVTKKLPCQPCYRRFKKAFCEHHNCLNTLEPNETMKRIEDALWKQ